VSTVKVRVLDGWAVHDGDRHRTGGDVLDVDGDTAKAWLAAGLVELAPTTTARKR
jgi:hypothetical protein